VHMHVPGHRVPEIGSLYHAEGAREPEKTIRVSATQLQLAQIVGLELWI
jgi:hypothetical protein